jgi:hypothetical protein
MFNVNSFIYSLLANVTLAFKNDWEIVKTDVESFLADTKPRLQLIATAAIDGEISPADLKQYLANELQIVETQLLALEVVTKQMAEDAFNSIISTATNMLGDLIPKTPAQ